MRRTIVGDDRARESKRREARRVGAESLYWVCRIFRSSLVSMMLPWEGNELSRYRTRFLFCLERCVFKGLELVFAAQHHW